MPSFENKPDLDLIARVQQARMQHDAEAVPSAMVGVYWIEAHDQSGTAQPPTKRSGQWIIGVEEPDLDAAWAVIKGATEAGKLGYKSKISTATGLHAIFVKTHDYADRADVARVRDALRDLGVTAEIRYEADQQAEEPS